MSTGTYLQARLQAFEDVEPAFPIWSSIDVEISFADYDKARREVSSFKNFKLERAAGLPTELIKHGGAELTKFLCGVSYEESIHILVPINRIV